MCTFLLNFLNYFLKCRKETATATNEAAKNGKEKDNKPSGMWAPAELQLLIKAVNLYPPGIQERWKVCRNYFYVFIQNF